MRLWRTHGLEENRLESTRARLAVALAEHIGLALANLRLREALRNQSIVDPLTGLFNRRYLEQTLERECRRAVRAGRRSRGCTGSRGTCFTATRPAVASRVARESG